MKKYMKRPVVISRLRCLECKHEFPIPRSFARRRKGGHVKHIWCINCRKRTKHVEQESTKYNL